MSQAESYLNTILQKRLGSVINDGSVSKNAHTVTRLPRKEQKVENMPTVFKKKHETSYKYQDSKEPSEYLSAKMSEPQSNQMSRKKANERSHRVQYLLISKRIEQRQDDDFVSPTVDVSKFSKSKQEPVHPQINKIDGIKTVNIKKGGSHFSSISESNSAIQEEEREVNSNVNVQEEKSTTKSKRRRIFE